MTQRRPEGGQQAVLGLPGGSPGLAGDGSWVTWGWSGNDPEAAGRRSDVLQSRRPCREQGVPPLPRAPLHPASHPLSTGKPCEAAGARAWRGRAARMAQVPATPGARPAPGASPSPAPAEPPSGRRGPRGRAFVFVGVRSVPSRVLVSGVVARSCGCRFGWEGTERGLPAACPLARARARAPGRGGGFWRVRLQSPPAGGERGPSLLVSCAKARTGVVPGRSRLRPDDSRTWDMPLPRGCLQGQQLGAWEDPLRGRGRGPRPCVARPRA